jgi:hypothetical protein
MGCFGMKLKGEMNILLLICERDMTVSMPHTDWLTDQLKQLNYVLTKTRGGVRSTQGLGPTMTARGQSIGIAIGMLGKLIRTNS